MAHPPVLILGYSEAAMWLRETAAANVCAIIAIKGQRDCIVETGGVPRSLILEFDDMEAPSRTDSVHAARIRMRQRQAAEIGLRLIPPDVEHARSIIDFARALDGLDGTVLCQCQGGVSRSPAAALLCLATWTGPGHERYCVERVLNIRPHAVPHLDLVGFGDELLGRNGALVESLQRVRPY
jgi:predicted protein tyrosine phosphatase